MKQPLKMIFLGFMVLAVFVFLSLTNVAQADQVRYIPPPNISIAISPKNPEEKIFATSSFSLTGTISPLVGNPRDLEIFFESSRNLMVSPESAKIARLDSKKPAVFTILVKPTSRRADEGGTFVRVRVVYHPDFAAIASFTSDEKRYSDPGERTRLKNLLDRNLRENATQTDATRFFLH